MALLLVLHLMATVIWVGGMFFAYMALRPALSIFEPPDRLTLWARVFARFFPWVWGSVAVLLGTGYGVLFGYFGGFGDAGLYIHLMHGIGLVMMLIFAHIFFAPYKRLRNAVAIKDWAAGGAALNQIRRLVAINLALGLLVVAIAVGGPYI
jgi:uncharacterized membrane protein